MMSMPLCTVCCGSMICDAMSSLRFLAQILEAHISRRSYCTVLYMYSIVTMLYRHCQLVSINGESHLYEKDGVFKGQDNMILYVILCRGRLGLV